MGVARNVRGVVAARKSLRLWDIDRGIGGVNAPYREQQGGRAWAAHNCAVVGCQ